MIKTLLAKIFKPSASAETWPARVSQSSGERTLYFDIYSEVERYRTGDYGGEKVFLDQFLSCLRPEDIIYDIGASVGLFTVHAAAIAVRGQVIAFEPDPQTAERLQRNLEINHLSNVRVVPWAVTDHCGAAELYTDGAAGFAPTLRKQADRPGAPKGVAAVETKTLDQAIASQELPSPTVLKIDIEGAEILCLKGASRLLAGELGRKPRVIALELHPQFLPDFGSTTEAVRELVESRGYAVGWKQDRDGQIQYCYVDPEN
jgi:FkbM family methyltransferase